MSIQFHNRAGVSVDLRVALRGADRTQDQCQNWYTSSLCRGGVGVCEWIIRTSGSVGFDCLGLVCIRDKRMYLGTFSYILC